MRAGAAALFVWVLLVTVDHCAWARRRSVAVLHYGGSSSSKYADLKGALRTAITHLVSELKDDSNIRTSDWAFCQVDFDSEDVEPTPIPADFWRSHNTILEVLYGDIVGEVARTEIYIGDVGDQLGKPRVSMWLPVQATYLGQTKRAFSALTLFSLAMNASRAGDRIAAYHILVLARAELPAAIQARHPPPKEFINDFTLLQKAIESQIKAHQGTEQ